MTEPQDDDDLLSYRKMKPLLTVEQGKQLRYERMQQEVATQKMHVSVKRREEAFKQKQSKKQDNVDNILESADSIFPTWLKDRGDFQKVFPRFLDKKIPLTSLIELIVRKEKTHRTNEDMQNLAQFISQFPLLNNFNFSADLTIQLCKALLRQEYSTNHVIYQCNSSADSFFMLLEGQIGLYDVDDNLISTVNENQSFGDSAIEGVELDIEQDVKYTSTAKVMSPKAILLELRAVDFREKIKSAYENRIFILTVLLEKKVDLFARWSKNRIHRLASKLQMKLFKPNEVIIQTGTPSDQMFFIKDGSCDVQREVVYNQTNKWPTSIHRNEHQVLENKHVISTSVATLDSGKYFGEDFFLGHATRLVTVYALTTVEVLVLKAEDARELFNDKIVGMIRANYHAVYPSLEKLLVEQRRRHRQLKEYQTLKHESLGENYLSRLNKSRSVDSLALQAANKARSKSGTRKLNLHTQSSVTLPSVAGARS